MDSGRCSGFWGGGVAGRRGGRIVVEGPSLGTSTARIVFVGCGIDGRGRGVALVVIGIGISDTYCCSAIDQIQFVDEVFSVAGRWG